MASFRTGAHARRSSWVRTPATGWASRKLQVSSKPPKYNRVEYANGKRRDVFVALVPETVEQACIIAVVKSATVTARRFEAKGISNRAQVIVQRSSDEPDAAQVAASEIGDLIADTPRSMIEVKTCASTEPPRPGYVVKLRVPVDGTAEVATVLVPDAGVDDPLVWEAAVDLAYRRVCAQFPSTYDTRGALQHAELAYLGKINN